MARIGTTNYSSIDAAFRAVNAATQPTTVTILADGSFTQYVDTKARLTIDLNGHTIRTNTSSCICAYQADVTIMDSSPVPGKIVATSSEQYIIGLNVQKSHTLTVKNGVSVYVSSAKEPGGTDMKTCAVKVTEASKLIMHGGTLSASGVKQIYGVYAEGYVELTDVAVTATATTISTATTTNTAHAIYLKYTINDSYHATLNNSQFSAIGNAYSLYATSVHRQADGTLDKVTMNHAFFTGTPVGSGVMMSLPATHPLYQSGFRFVAGDAGCRMAVLSEAAEGKIASDSVSESASYCVYARNLYRGFNTLCMPFGLTMDMIPDDAALYTIGDCSDGILYIHEVTSDGVNPGEPCLLYLPQDDLEHYEFRIHANDSISPTASSVEKSGVSLVGTYTSTTDYNATGNSSVGYGIASDGLSLSPIRSGGALRPFRAAIVPDRSQAVAPRIIVADLPTDSRSLSAPSDCLRTRKVLIDGSTQVFILHNSFAHPLIPTL